MCVAPYLCFSCILDPSKLCNSVILLWNIWLFLLWNVCLSQYITPNISSLFTAIKIKPASIMCALTSTWHRIDFITLLDQIICGYAWAIWKRLLDMDKIPLKLCLLWLAFLLWQSLVCINCTVQLVYKRLTLLLF